MKQDKLLVYLNKAGENWVADRFRKEWYKNNKSSTNIPSRANLLWVISPWTWKSLDINKLKQRKVLCTIHHIDTNKLSKTYLEDFYERDKFVDSYHVPSLKSKEQLTELTDKKINHIPFWIDQKKFFTIKNRKNLRKKYNLSNEDYVVGSFQRDTEGHDLHSPKLSKGPDLFVENILKLKEEKNNLKVLLAGYRRQYIIRRLKEENINYVYIEKPNFRVLNELYNILDFYIVSSRIEGGPQAILECALLKIPIVSTDVGIASEILHPNSIYDMNTFHQAQPEINYAHEKAKDFIIPNIMKSFNDLLELIYEG